MPLQEREQLGREAAHHQRGCGSSEGLLSEEPAQDVPRSMSELAAVNNRRTRHQSRRQARHKMPVCTQEDKGEGLGGMVLKPMPDVFRDDQKGMRRQSDR